MFAGNDIHTLCRFPRPFLSTIELPRIRFDLLSSPCRWQGSRVTIFHTSTRVVRISPPTWIDDP